jgi:hypothetical protein
MPPGTRGRLKQDPIMSELCVVEAEGEHERYRWKREGLRYAIRAGTGTRVLFRVWRERTALILCTELLCAYNDGYFVRSKSTPQTEPDRAPKEET